jgi:hypothetical protein
MRLSTAIFSILAVAPSVLSSVIIPGYITEGLWIGVPIDDDGGSGNFTGNYTWSQVPNIPEHLLRRQACRLAGEDDSSVAAPVLDASAVSRRDTTGCTGRGLDPFEYTRSYELAHVSDTYTFPFLSLPDVYKDTCSLGINIPARAISVWPVCRTFWFNCNWRYSSYRCNPNDLVITIHSTQYRCGQFGSGWDYLSVPDISWGVEHVGFGVC